MANFLRALMAGAGAWIGLALGCLLPPTTPLIGTKFPLALLIDFKTNNFAEKAEIVGHLLLATAIGGALFFIIGLLFIRSSRTGDVSNEKLNITSAAESAWRVFRQHPWRFVALLFIPVLGSFAVQIVVAIVQLAVGAAAGRDSVVAVIVVLVLSVVAFLAQYALQFTCQLAALWGAARASRGESFTIGPALNAAFGRLLSYVGLVILTILVFVLGFLPLVIPGVVASGFLAVAPVACVVERRGPIDSMKRSINLVDDNWWRSFGYVLLTIMLPFFAFSVVSVIVYIICAAAKIPALALIMLIPAIPFFIALGAFATAVPAILFVDLRSAKEGRGKGDVADVFE